MDLAAVRRAWYAWMGMVVPTCPCPPLPGCSASCMVRLVEHGDDHGHGEEAKAQGEEQVEE